MNAQIRLRKSGRFAGCGHWYMMTRNSEPSDADLVARVLAGDRDAFGSLYDRYARLVRAIVSDAMISDSRIQDLTQECFLRAFQNLARLRQPLRFRFWIVGIARQVAREHRRALRRNRHVFTDVFTLQVTSAPSAEAVVQTAEETEIVMRLVSGLPERERLAIHAFFLQECDASQAAQLLCLSRSGVYALLERAMARLAAEVHKSLKKGVE
jgi:RNA polymerase sigma-70 factor (ECF subfamily)